MQYGAMVLPILLPVTFWACYHNYKDRHLPEPVSHLALAFGLGIGSYYLGILMYRALDLVNLRYDAYLLADTNLPGLFAYAVLVIGLIEESVKLVPFLLVIIASGNSTNRWTASSTRHLLPLDSLPSRISIICSM